MTRKRVCGIHKFAVLIALSAFIPTLAAAQELPFSSYTFGCYEPESGAYFVCQDLIYDNGMFDLIGTKACPAYCRNAAQTCVQHVVMLSRCLDRANKDLLMTWDAYCNGYWEGDPAGIKSCAQSNQQDAMYFKAALLNSAAYAKEYCRGCYEDCIGVCEGPQ